MRWVGIRDDLASKPPAHVARGQTPLNVTRPVLVNGGANVRALIELPHIRYAGLCSGAEIRTERTRNSILRLA